MKEMIADFLKVQQNLPSIAKEGTGNYGKYMLLDELLPKARKVLNENNFVVIQSPSIAEGQPALTTTLLHTSGETISDTMLLILDKNTAQGQGSAITYARRYALASMLGLVADEDDDGQKATDHAAPKKFAPSNPASFITEAQVKLVVARLKQKGAGSMDEVNLMVYDITGKDKVSEVTKGEMPELLDHIDVLPDAEQI